MREQVARLPRNHTFFSFNFTFVGSTRKRNPIDISILIWTHCHHKLALGQIDAAISKKRHTPKCCALQRRRCVDDVIHFTHYLCRSRTLKLKNNLPSPSRGNRWSESNGRCTRNISKICLLARAHRFRDIMIIIFFLSWTHGAPCIALWLRFSFVRHSCLRLAVLVFCFYLVAERQWRQRQRSSSQKRPNERMERWLNINILLFDRTSRRSTKYETITGFWCASSISLNLATDDTTLLPFFYSFLTSTWSFWWSTTCHKFVQCYAAGCSRRAPYVPNRGGSTVRSVCIKVVVWHINNPE